MDIVVGIRKFCTPPILGSHAAWSSKQYTGSPIWTGHINKFVFKKKEEKKREINKLPGCQNFGPFLLNLGRE